MTRSVHLALVTASFLCPFVHADNVVVAGPVPLPFYETFNAVTMDAVTDYPHFTAQIPAGQGGAIDPMWSVTELGRLRAGSASWAPTYQPSFSVKPDPMPTGEIIIRVDMGWNGQDVDPVVGAGFGGVGLRLGQFEDTTESEDAMVFHPGFPGGAFRVEGEGGFDNQNMGWTPAVGVMHHVEIHSFPDGLFNIKVTDGANPANVYTKSFTNPFAYGGDIGLLAHAGGASYYDNLRISIAGQTLPADLDEDFDVDGADFLLIQSNFGGTTDGTTFDAFASTFGTQYALPNLAAVPEPTSSLSMLAVGVGLPALRRRRVA